MRIIWLPAAGQDLVEIRHYIAEAHPAAAAQVAKRILDTVAYLRDHPEIGRVGRIPGTRELVLPGLPYIVPYRVKGTAIEILGVLHAAQEWPKEL
jgi:addiction module RelE/StbE family toxin